MARWESRYQEHGLWNTLQELRTKLDEHGDSTGAQTRESLDHLNAVYTMAVARRDSTPSVSVTMAMLDSADAALRRAVDILVAVPEDEEADPGSIDVVTDAILTTFATWPAPSADAASRAVSDQLARMSTESAALLADLGLRRDQIQTEYDSLFDELVGLREEVATEKTTNAAVRQTFETDSTESLASELAAWTAAREEAELQAQAKLAKMETLEKQANDVVHSTTGVATATDFGKYARNQGIVAAIYDFIAGAVGILGVTSLIIHLYKVGEANSDLGLSLTRLAASLGTLGIAGLIGTRGGQHHAEARAAKRTDLTLRRMDPFTVNLDEDTRQAIIEETTARIFIRGELTQVEGDDASIVDRLRKRATELYERRNQPDEATE